MKALLNMKFAQLVKPQLKNNGAFTGNTYFDTVGLGSALVLFNVGVTDAILGSTDTSTPPKIEQCDTTDGTYTDLSGATLAAVIAATDDNKLYGIKIDLTKTHKRYMRVNAPTAGNGTTGINASITLIATPLDVSPVAAAGMGLTEFIQA